MKPKRWHEDQETKVRRRHAGGLLRRGGGFGGRVARRERTHPHCCTGAPPVPATSSSFCPGQWFSEHSRAKQGSRVCAAQAPHLERQLLSHVCLAAGQVMPQRAAGQAHRQKAGCSAGQHGEQSGAKSSNRSLQCVSSRMSVPSSVPMQAGWGRCCTHQWPPGRGHVPAPLHASERQQAAAACCLGCSALCSQR